MRTFVTRVVLLLGATAAVAGTTAAVARQVAAPQKALVYCPVGVDAAGCTAIQATLAASPAFTGGVDLGYDGSSGTVDLAAVDLAQYAVVVVPSLAADDTRDPYAVLRSAAVQGRLRVGLTGRVAVWAGTPDLGSANRAEKDQLLRNLAAWGARDWPLAGSTGLVALADLSADAARRYDWLAGVSRLHVAADGELYSFDAVTPVTGTAKEILKKADGTTPLAYANMASFGLSVADGSTGGTLDAKASTTDASGATVTETVLITAPGGNNTGGASLATDKGDYTPGETVTFTGGGWTAGETVTITVHENPTEHEDRTLTAVADSEGRIRNAELVMEPHHLGVTFYVTARGGTSGLVAQTSFTDGGVTVKAGPVNSTVTFNLTVADYKTSGTCSGTPSSITSSISVNATTAYVNNGLGNGQSYKLTASANATSAPNGAFQGWQRTGGSAPVTTIDAFSICVAGPNQADLVATYANASPATSLAVGAAAGTYGGTTTLTATLTAGGSAVSGQSVTFTLNGAGVGSATTNGSGVATLSSVPLGTINAGSYPAGVGASFSGSTTPALTASNGTASLTVNKAPLSVTANNASRAYGAANPALTGTLSGVVAGDAISASFVTTATQASPAGSYPITPVLADAGSRLGNYNVTSTNGTLTVGKATLTVTPNGASRAYGEANPELSGTITGLLAGDNIGATYATTATETSPVGTYDITATLVDPDSKASNYIVTLNKGTLTVGKAKITVTAADAQRAYGAANPPLTGTLTGVASGDGITASYSTAAVASSPAGTYPITPTLNDPNHKLGNYDVLSTDGTLTVTKATLTVVANAATREYGDPNPPFSGALTGVMGGDHITASYVAGSGGTVGPTSAVGAYAIVPVLSDPDGKLGNYVVTITNGTLTITRAALTVTAGDASRAYGDPNPTFTGTVTGIKNGEAIEASYGTAATATSPVGTYPITAAVQASPATLLDNYTVTAHDGTLTITRAALTITAADASREYGDANPALSGSLAGIKNGDGISATYSTGATAASAVGTYEIVPAAVDATPSKLANYDVTLVKGTLTVTKAPLSVTPNDATRLYGAANPAFGGNVAGVKNGDAITATYGTTAVAASDVGTYDITATLEDPDNKLGNYVSTLHVGKLTITPAPLTVTAEDKSKTYGADLPPLTAHYDGLVLGQTASVLGGTLAFATTATKASPVGSYDVTPSGLTSTNYQITFAKGQLTITPAPLAVKVNDVSKVRGDVNPPFTVSYSGFVLGEGPGVVSGTPSLGTTANVNSVEGQYPITWNSPSGLTAANYAINALPGTLTVTKNFAPVITKFDVPVDPRLVNSPVPSSVTFTDVDVSASTPYAVTIDWGDNTPAYSNTAVASPGTVSATHSYAAAGVYTVVTTVSDKIPGNTVSQTFQYVVVYDPSGGFVTGGGWINSPAGAYAVNPALSGKATFGFVSKYQKGANLPTGNTQFQFHAAGLDFKSTVYEWLVISGTRAQYKGSGTINGTGDYGFLLTAVDGQSDQFRIKITNRATGQVVYDNQVGASDTDPLAGNGTVLGGGSIQIQSK